MAVREGPGVDLEIASASAREAMRSSRDANFVADYLSRYTTEKPCSTPRMASSTSKKMVTIVSNRISWDDGGGGGGGGGLGDADSGSEPGGYPDLIDGLGEGGGGLGEDPVAEGVGKGLGKIKHLVGRVHIRNLEELRVPNPRPPSRSRQGGPRW